jgi:AbrB family looped-hinge helix DNA binding protein
MDTIYVGRRGQITLPSRLRKKIGIQEGDRLALLLDGNDVVLRPISQSLFDLRGSIRVTDVQDFDLIRRQVMEAHTRQGKKDAS